MEGHQVEKNVNKRGRLGKNIQGRSIVTMAERERNVLCIKRVVSYLLGLFMTCIGVAAVLKTGWGVDAWNGVFAGLERLTAWSIGVWSVIIQGCFWCIAAFLNKKADLCCIIPIALKGILLDVARDAVFLFPFPDTAPIKCLLFLVGYVLVGVGTGIYVETGYPRMPIDGLMLAIADFFSWDVRKSRLLIEISGFTALQLVRGPLGLGTVIITLTIGHVVSLSRKWTQTVIFRED